MGAVVEISAVIKCRQLALLPRDIKKQQRLQPFKEAPYLLRPTDRMKYVHVTREEFDVQRAVLLRTREKLDEARFFLRLCEDNRHLREFNYSSVPA